MFVINVTDHHLHDVFMADETVGATIFVNDKSKLGALCLHALQQIGGEHRRWNKQDLANKAGFLDRLA
ncbi:hypothetical protein D3C80_1233790 [compost metagenome]